MPLSTHLFQRGTSYIEPLLLSWRPGATSIPWIRYWSKNGGMAHLIINHKWKTFPWWQYVVYSVSGIIIDNHLQFLLSYEQFTLHVKHLQSKMYFFCRRQILSQKVVECPLTNLRTVLKTRLSHNLRLFWAISSMTSTVLN